MQVVRRAGSKPHRPLLLHKKQCLSVLRQSFGFITTCCQGHKSRCSRAMRSKSSSKINCPSPPPCTGMVYLCPQTKMATHRTACLRAENVFIDLLCPKEVPAHIGITPTRMV